MKTSIKLGTVIAALLPLAVLAAAVDYTPDYTRLSGHDEHHAVHDSALVNRVHEFAKQFKDPDSLLRLPGWVVGTGCVSGPETGAMGIHVVNLDLTKDGVLEPEHPEAFIYEPQPNGNTVLVGVEFIQDAADWAARNPHGGPPLLDGHQMNLVGAPNQFGLDPFFELHVWAFEDNPKGAFADWNTHVTCEKQPLKFQLK